MCKRERERDAARGERLAVREERFAERERKRCGKRRDVREGGGGAREVREESKAVRSGKSFEVRSFLRMFCKNRGLKISHF